MNEKVDGRPMDKRNEMSGKMEWVSGKKLGWYRRDWLRKKMEGRLNEKFMTKIERFQ